MYFFAKKLKLILDKTEFHIFIQISNMKVSPHFSQSVFLVNSCFLLRWSGTLVYGLKIISHSEIIFRTHVSLVLLKCVILRISDAISQKILILWLHMLWMANDLTAVIPCLAVSLLLIFISCNVSRSVLLESLPIPPCTLSLWPSG